jgi:hypothetical protein
LSRARTYVVAGLVCGLVVVPLSVAAGIPIYLSGLFVEVVACWAILGLASFGLSLRGFRLEHAWDRSRGLAVVGMTIGAIELVCSCFGLLAVITNPPVID